MRALARTLLCACAVLACAPAHAKVRALLVGVSEYPNLPPEKALNGPRSDVPRMRDALLARGLAAQDATILADGVEGAAGLPTRDAILDAMKRLAQDAGKGDLVVVYATGHGSRQKDENGDEPDGLDEVFLPRDATMPESASAGKFGAAIVDDEIGERLDAIRATGADVWFVLDSCFSGSASRAAPETTREKKIDPPEAVIAVAAQMTPDRQVLLERPAVLPPGAGTLVAFYAAQPTETAREVALPAGAPLARRTWSSIFTLALTQALKTGGATTYRQVMVETGRILRADPSFQARQTPSFEGDGLDALLPGAKDQAPGAWRVADGVLEAGLVEGVDAGALVALYETLEQGADRPSGYALVAQAQGLRASLNGLRDKCDPLARACAADAKSASLRKARYARLARPAPGAALRVSTPRPWPGVTPGPAATEAAKGLQDALTGPLKGKVEMSDASPDLVAWQTGEGLRFMPAALDPREAEAGPAVAIGGAIPADVAVGRALLRARQTQTLQKLRGLGAGGVEVIVETRRHPFDARRNACLMGRGRSGELVAEGAPVERCDRVIATLVNSGAQPIYPVAFFLDDSWNMIALKPSCPAGIGVNDRLEPGSQITVEIPYHAKAIGPGPSPRAQNGLFVAAVPFREGETSLPNLCGLRAFNDAATTRGEETDDFYALVSGNTRAGGRLPLEATTMGFAFWDVKRPSAP